MVEIGLSILRAFVGVLFAAHGAQKLFGWFGGPGMEKWAQIVAGMHLRPAALWAWVQSLAEFLGGVLFALGVLTPVAAAALISVMLMAIAKVHAPNGFFNTNRGYEFNLTLIAALLAVGLAGGSAYALGPQTVGGVGAVTLFAVSVLIGALGVGVGLVISGRGEERQTA